LTPSGGLSIHLSPSKLPVARPDPLLYLLGISALASRAALFLELAPLFVGVVMGVLMVDIAPDRRRVFRVLERWGKAIYIVLLVLAGARLSFPSWWVVALALAYVIVNVEAALREGDQARAEAEAIGRR